MMNEVIIYTQAQPLAVREYQGQRVITFKDVDALHQRPEGTARRNFNANRERFIEGEDYFVRNSYEAKEEFGVIAPNGLVLITKMGYLMLVKSFTDELAWMIQRQLVKSYFEAQNVLLGSAAVEQIPAYAGNLSTIFLQAIQQAIDRGEYYLRPKYKHMGKSTPRSGSIFGVYDRHEVYLISRLAYDIYAAAACDPVYIKKLWFMLELAGTIMPRKETGRVCIVPGKTYKTIGLSRDKLRV